MKMDHDKTTSDLHIADVSDQNQLSSYSAYQENESKKSTL